MKYLYPLLLIGFATQAISQISYVNTDWVIDQTQVMSNDEVDTLELDFDQDGTLDMRIYSWSNHTNGIPTVVEALMLDAVGFGGLQSSIFNCDYLQDCPSSGFEYESITGYIFTSNSTCNSNPYANQYVKFPFLFQGNQGIHCGFLYVRYQGTTITIEGYAWNPSPGENCSCSSSGWLSLQENQSIESIGNFEYFNLLGQKVENPQGLTLKVFENGSIQKVYITSK